jgi:prepilin-type N-terminal cleavage/methylation domain-containing protein
VLERLRFRARAEEGMTLTELSITMMILGIVLATILSVLFSVQRGFGRQQDRSVNNDQARLAVEELDREIRSGNLLYDPQSAVLSENPTGDPSGMQLVIYTQTNATTRNPGNRCVQWKITNAASQTPDQLQRRDWSSLDPLGSVSPWRVIAEDVVNNDPAKNGRGAAVPAFTLDHSQSSFGDRNIKVDILVNHNPNSGRTVEIVDSVTGRNTEFGYPNTVCNTVPPG